MQKANFKGKNSMTTCKNCRHAIEEGNLLKCPNCNAEICADCAEKLKNICPYCYSELDIYG